MQCPECKRENFANMLGFVNHCRIMHGMTFQSPEERVSKCGVYLESDQIPSELLGNYLKTEEHFVL